MSTIKNSVRLIGNLGAAPTIVNTDKGLKIARVSIATSDYYYNDKKEKVTETYWHNLVFFGKSAENAEKLLKKGSELAIEGKLVSRSYEKEGAKKYVTEIVVNEFNLFGSKESA
ncbi:MAG: single-stranded DNA-binding protein [Chitinophagales bacterium]|jgi:single-strand DNA-binding protein|nr:single-stranded DNA-binding protein [Sphingobacteriales bacterium]